MSAGTGGPPSSARAAPRVMLLSLWTGDLWHARLVEADNQTTEATQLPRVHEFDSPFELARFLAQVGHVAVRGTPQGGLR